MTLKTWISSLSVQEQDRFFRQAARFFSNRELSYIIENIKAGCSLYQAHLRTGVLDRCIVDLENLRREM
ncbi:MAG: hypothetical protein JEZ04_06365 [Spirochaetales bacterium]|nr:hypothetical protein [Spirochaetales bacterium]